MSVEASYEQRLSILQSTLNVDRLHYLVHSRWHEPRPAMSQHDSQIPAVRGSLVREIAEAQVERDWEGTDQYSPKAEATEATDVLSYLLSLKDMHNLPITNAAVLHGINGYGKRSDIFDRMSETSGNIESTTLTQDVTQMLRYLVAYLAGMPEPASLEKSLVAVIDKNTLNYPAQFFNGLHPRTRKVLTAEELQLQYQHSLRCIKAIRFSLREIKHLRDRDYGMHPEDWKKYSPLIADFEHSKANVAQLLSQLKVDLLLTDQENQRLIEYFTNKVLSNQC